MRLITTPQGDQFWVYNSDGIGREVEARGGWEEHLYKYFAPPKQPDVYSAGWGRAWCALEVGANIGVHTRRLAREYFFVIAVEPLTALALRANTAHLKDVAVHEVAGWSSRELLYLLSPRLQQTTMVHRQEACPNVGAAALAPASQNTYWNDESQPGAVQGLPLDLIVGLRWIDFIKIDAQGCDYATLLGLEETVKRCRPFILSEYEPDLAKLHGVTPEIYRKWFADHEYLEGPVDGDRVNSWGVPKERLGEAEAAGCGVNL